MASLYELVRTTNWIYRHLTHPILFKQREYTKVDALSEPCVNWHIFDRLYIWHDKMIDSILRIEHVFGGAFSSNYAYFVEH